jgi:predicted permease
LINGHPFQIVGVSAPGFRSAIWGEDPEIFVPMAMLGEVLPGNDSRLINHQDKWMNILGRLKPGVSRARAETAMNPLWHALRGEELKALGKRSKKFTDDFFTYSRMRVLPGARGFSYDRGDYELPLLAVMAMAALVLLIAAINVASLLLVRSANRMREFSLRYALGARAGRIMQQLWMEGLMIGLGGGIAGIAFAAVAMRTLVHRLASDDGTADFTNTMDVRLLVFNFAVAVAVSILFSLAPAWQLRRPDLSAAMGQRSATGSGHALSFRRVVVCVQIGLSIVLLAGAGLFVRSMQKLRSVDVGFNPSHLIGFGIDPILAGYPAAAVPALQQQALERLSAVAGMQSVAATTDPELAGHDRGGNVTVDGFTPPADDDFDVEKSFITPNYFSTLQIPLLAGRSFNESDDATHPLVAIVNESFVRHFCSSVNDCLGRRVGDHGGDHTKLDTVIVGVVRDNKHYGLRNNAKATAFRPLRQQPDSSSVYFTLRTYGDPDQSLGTIRKVMQQVDAKLPLQDLRTMDEQIDDNLTNDRLVTLLAISFGVLAALLAGVGIYGVLAYSTAQRTREIGIRIALGSSRLGVARIILADVLILAGIGIAVALPVACGLTRFIKSQLFGVSPADPMSLLFAVMLVALIAIIAALIPAQRAATVDPTQALRTE